MKSIFTRMQLTDERWCPFMESVRKSFLIKTLISINEVCSALMAGRHHWTSDDRVLHFLIENIFRPALIEPRTAIHAIGQSCRGKKSRNKFRSSFTSAQCLPNFFFFFFWSATTLFHKWNFNGFPLSIFGCSDLPINHVAYYNRQ